MYNRYGTNRPYIFRSLKYLKHCIDSTPIYIKDLFDEKDKIYNLCSTVSLKQPKCNIVTYGLNSFQYKGAKIWNDLPNKIKNSITLAEFKNQIKKWQVPKYLCKIKIVYQSKCNH